MMVLCLLFSVCAFADNSEIQVAAAPLSTGGEVNGMVRVYLASLGNPAELHLTVNGSYTVNGDTQNPLNYGAKLTVGFNASTGKLTLTHGGATRSMGSSFTLKRHRTEGENGLRIQESYSESNLFPGDLEFRVKASGNSYKLYPIVHVYMEDYLMGVVPYEMGNANPLEALKAQTVAARTYTMRAMQSASSRDYDLVDTASDQVYRGTPTGNSNCKKAIEETRGIVSMNGSSFTGTFYTASNGGQIESPRNLWGGSGYPYITVKDDPFDLANPGSRVRAFTVSASGNQGNAVLQQMLDAKATKQLGKTAKVKGVSAVTPHTPKYPEPSRLYTKLDFAVFAQVDQEIQSLTLTFDIFSELETPLSMSHSSMQNELWTVTETDGGFRVEARRWGHGTGMSQRGAMQMGSLGYNYTQILNFYFEGCRLVQYQLTSTILSPIVKGQESQVESSKNTAAPVPDGTDTPIGETVLAKVTTQKGGLNLRAEGSSQAKVLLTIPRNEVIEISEVLGDWCRTSYKGYPGFVMTSFLTFINGDAPTPTPVPSLPDDVLQAQVTTQQGSLNLRSGASTSHRVLITIPRNHLIPIYEKGDRWCKTAYNGYEGYVMTEFLTFRETAATATPAPENTPTPAPDATATTAPEDDSVSIVAYGKVTTKQGSLNLRESASGSARVLTTIPRHQVIELYEVGSIWCKTSYAGHDGYVMTSFLTITLQNEGDNSGVIATAQVTTEKGSLNLRADPRAGARIVMTIPRHAYVNVYQMDDDWCAVTYEGTPGYVMTKFLTIDKDSLPTEKPTEKPTQAPTEKPTDAPTEAPDDEEHDEMLLALETPIVGKVNSNADTLNMRKGPGTKHEIIFDLPKGDYVMVTALGENWCRIIYEGKEGYCMRKFLILPDGY